jgi:LEA14-like dessication related protein
MANTFKALARGQNITSSSTVYTVPSATTTLVNNVLVANLTTSAQTYNVAFNDVNIATGVTVPANDTSVLDIKQVLNATQTIKVFGSSASVAFHIAGLEIT